MRLEGCGLRGGIACTKEERDMRLGQGMYQELKQSQVLSQSQKQSLEILAMTNQELRDFIMDEQMMNPMLEVEENGWLPGRGTPGTMGEAKQAEIPEEESVSLKEYLRSQICFSRYSKEKADRIRYVIEHIDEKTGYLKAEDFPNKEAFAWAIGEIQAMEPAGVGAADLSECLILQAKRQGILTPELLTILQEHLSDVAEGKISTISRKLRISTAETKEYIRQIKGMNPKPTAHFGGGVPEYVIPDVILKENPEGGFMIQLNDSWYGRVGMNRVYEEMAKSAGDSELEAYFTEKIGRAKFVLRCIEQRRETLAAVTRCIVNRQQDFILGEGEPKPMTLKDVAEQTGVHLSTVSRAVKNKYLEAPGGVYAFKRFFAAPAGKREHGLDTWTSETVKREIRQIIEEEDPKHPWSDQKITELLEAKEILISRRTVAKYREELGVGSAFERKE